MSTLGDFCGSTLGDFVVSALWDRGCEPKSCYGCSFLPHTFSVELSGISGSLVWYGREIEPFDLSVCNRNYSVSLPAWSEPRCYSNGTSPTMGPLLWYSDPYNTYVRYWLQLTMQALPRPLYGATSEGNQIDATPEGNQIIAKLHILVQGPYLARSLFIEWSIVLPWTDADCCHGIGRNLPMVGSFSDPLTDIHFSPGTGDGSICTITS